MTERESILRELSDRELCEFAAAGCRLPADLACRARRHAAGRHDERTAADGTLTALREIREEAA